MYAKEKAWSGFQGADVYIIIVSLSVANCHHNASIRKVLAQCYRRKQCLRSFASVAYNASPERVSQRTKGNIVAEVRVYFLRMM